MGDVGLGFNLKQICQCIVAVKRNTLVQKKEMNEQGPQINGRDVQMQETGT